MSYQFHTLVVENKIATVGFNNPPLNINTEAVMDERCKVLNKILDDPDVGTIIITSAIEGHFGAGSDLHEYLTESKEIYRQSTERVLETVRRYIESDKISIAAINGNAIGSTADLTLMCDIRIMGKPYYLRWPEAYLGLMPNWGASTLLPMLVGRAHALEWLLMNRNIHTDELKNAGLLHAVHPVEDLQAQAQALAKRFVEADRKSVKAIKLTVLNSYYMPLVYAFGADVQLSTELFGTEASLERARAFLEHRQAQILQDEE